MILTDEHIEAIKAAAKTVDYGSVTINISATSDNLDLTIQNRVRFPKETETVVRNPHLAKVLPKTGPG